MTAIHMRAGLRRRRGFNLIEVVVAVTLLAAGALFCSQIFASSLKFIEADREITSLIEVAENQLADALLNTQLDAGTRLSGAEGEMNWTIETTTYQPFSAAPAAMPPGAVNLVKVAVTVTQGEDGRSLRLEGIKTVKKPSAVLPGSLNP